MIELETGTIRPETGRKSCDGPEKSQLRERLGCSQEELGQRATCGVRTIRKIENSEAVSADSLRAVAEKLGLKHWHELLTEAERARLGVWGAPPASPPSPTEASAPRERAVPVIPTDRRSSASPPVTTPPAETVDVILILLDVVGYTPQARRVGGEATRQFDEYLEGEITRRASPHRVRWIKPIGDAALLWCERPVDLLEFVRDLLVRLLPFSKPSQEGASVV
jgi:transcriptional regulator with XRE-family HTH domain